VTANIAITSLKLFSLFNTLAVHVRSLHVRTAIYVKFAMMLFKGLFLVAFIAQGSKARGSLAKR
jgi:hypothetical protein